MDDTICRVCDALITPVGQTDGVFCPSRGCPFVRLSRFDVTNTCAVNTFCLNFSGQRVEVRASAPAPSPVVLEKKRAKPKSSPAVVPGLFDTPGGNE